MEGGFIVEPDLEAEKPSTSRRFNPQDYTDDLIHSASQAFWELQGAEQSPQCGCSKCNSLSYSDEFFKAFNVMFCNQCRRNEKLISKSTAKQSYQLTDGDISKLGSVKRSNPHKKDWQPMRLYLESQVREVAFEKHGGAEGIEARARAVLDAKLQTRIKKRQEEKHKEQQETERLKRIRKKVEEKEEDVGVAIVVSDAEEI
jgi:DNA repair protein